MTPIATHDRSAHSVFTSTGLLGAWLLLLAGSIWSVREAWADILAIGWRDQEQSHIILVPIVAAWMAWIRRARLRHLRPSGTLFGPAIIMLGWGISYFGYHHAVQSCWHGGAVVVAVGAIVTGLGVNTLLKLFPAFVVLVFVVPVPGTIRFAISGPLQTASAYATQILLETFGVPIERSNNLLSINGRDVTVAEACNGMRMVLALILVSYAFAFSIPLRPYARALVLVGSPIAAIFCNIVRLIPTILLYGYAQESTASAWHDISGWLMLPLAFGVLLAITATLRWALIPVTRFTLAYQ
jgi:exosortase